MSIGQVDFQMNNKFFSGIRGKFLLYFTIGMVITVIAVSLVSYLTINDVLDRINDRTMQAEFSQITSGTEKLFGDIEQIIETSHLNRDMARMLLNYKNLSIPDLTYTINSYAKIVSSLTGSYSYINSVYIFINDEHILALSTNSIRQINYEIDYPSKKVLNAIAESSRGYVIKGGVNTADFPLLSKNTVSTPLIMVIKNMYIGSSRITILMNIYENELFSLYSGLVKNLSRKIRIITQDGMIVSSADKSEIGAQYKFFDKISVISPNSYTVDDEKQLRINWKNITNYDLIVVSEILSAEYMRDLESIEKRIVTVFLCGMGITCILFFIWVWHTLEPINKLMVSMQYAGKGDYSMRLAVTGRDELSLIANQYNTMLTDLQQLTDNKTKIEAELREKELKALRNQINPHFLYNTLNTVKCIAGINGDMKVSRCITLLGGIIEPLYKNDTPIWTLQEELNNVKIYLDIMNVRYCNEISYEKDVPEELENLFVMRFIIQPLVENAISHGFSTRSYKGAIRLSARMQVELLIYVEDNGTGMTDTQIVEYNEALNKCTDTGGIGMMNVNRRLRLRYGDDYGITLSRSGKGGLCVVVKLPINA